MIKKNFVSFIDWHDYAYNTNSTNVIEEEENDNNSVKGKDINFETKLNGDILGETLIGLLKDYGLDLKYCVGVGTDGCSVMVSVLRGAVKKIQSQKK